MTSAQFKALVLLYLPGTEVHVVTSDRHDPDAEALAAVVRYDIWEEAWVSDLYGLQSALDLRYSGVRLRVQASTVRHPDAPEEEAENYRIGALVVTISWPQSA